MARRRHAPLEPREHDIQAAVLKHWRLLGVPGSLVAAIPNAFSHGQAGLTPGLPDLIVLSPKLGDVTGYIELKREKGSPSADQVAIGEILIKRGAPYAVAFGRDQPIAILENWGAVKRAAA